MPRKLERFVICADNHGDHADEKTCGVFFEFIKHFRPHKRFHLGDGFNFAKLRQGATEAEKQERMEPDIVAGCDFLKKYKPDIYVAGNHCWRIFKLAKSTDEADRAYATSVIERMKKSLRGGKLIEYGKRGGHFQYGDFTGTHGFASGDNAARLMAQVFGNVFFGHNHFCDDQPVARMDYRNHTTKARGICIGCICATEQDYNAGQLKTLRQENGWIYGVKIGNRLVPYQAREVNGHWLFPSEFREIEPA